MAKYKNVYFDKIGYNRSAHEELFYKMEDDKRAENWKQEQQKYGGYVSRVTWNLDTLLIEELYTWLKMYLKFADVDLTFYKFKYHGKKMTEKECIKLILKKLKFVLLFDDSHVFDKKEYKKLDKKRREAFELLGIVLPSIWW